jgi:thiamine transport system ATP-binding protein
MSDEGPPRLEVDRVSVAFDGRPVLADVHLKVAPGEIVALLGPSGSGKSTLLRVVAGLTEPDAGAVRIDGIDVTALATHRRDVGLVFQDEQLFTNLDVEANVAFGLRMHRVAPAPRHERVVELLALVGLDGFGPRAVTTLSGGEAKRVAVARSLAPRPRVLLLDEPLTGLDRDLHDRLAADLARIMRAEHTTAVLVTHDPAEAAAIADRVVSLQQL